MESSFGLAGSKLNGIKEPQVQGGRIGGVLYPGERAKIGSIKELLS